MKRDEMKTGAQWARVLDPLHEWDPEWTEQYTRVVVNPWTDGRLSVKEIQLIAVGLNASITNLNATALRPHIRAALHAGASRAEILEVLKMAAILSLHSMSLGAPSLLEEAKAAGAAQTSDRERPAPLTLTRCEPSANGTWPGILFTTLIPSRPNSSPHPAPDSTPAAS
jgi:alkylhydroperoxidase/carboxymuconolactone decarboxylase family protein YurZ